MRALTVDVRQAEGRILCCTIFRPGGKKLFSKGHIIRNEDVQLLASEGMQQVWVTELEHGEVSEDDAVLQVGQEMGCGTLELRMAAGGRANLFATEDCCVLIDEELLRQINCTASVVIATTGTFKFVKAGERIATVKSAPFAVSQTQLDAILSILRERGPILQARPVRNPSVAVLYTDPMQGERARQLFDGVVRQRLEQYGAAPRYVLSVNEEESQVTKALQHLLRARPTALLVASTTAPAGPDDVIGRSMSAVGCHIERFLAPVEPGNLLLLGYMEDIPVVAAPGCFRSVKTNVIDLILPALLARYRVSGWEIASLGHGGLFN
jgi:molybdenum cofactor cytidylyltransferase